MNQIDKIRKGQVLYVVSTDGESIKPTEILEVKINCEKEDNPDRYKTFVTRYVGHPTDGTVLFFPEDFGKIIFIEPYDAHQKSKKNKKEQMFEKVATFFEKERNWERMRNCWYSNGCSHDFRELLKEAMELE